MRKLPFVAAVALFAAGCGDDGEGSTSTLDCAWLASESNCWRETVRAATSCLPEASNSGTFDPQGTTCTYDEDVVVHLGEPAEGATHDGYLWNVTVERDGAPCLEFVEHTEQSMELTTAAGTVSIDITESMDYQLTCPDGERLRAPALSLLECTDEEGSSDLSGLPGHFAMAMGGSASFGLVGMGDLPVQIFSCNAADTF